MVQPVNMREIARRAKVSASTVSVVLNGTPGVPVAGQTRDRVLREARRAGYASAAIARAIKSPLRHLGIAVGNLDEAFETFASVILQGAQQLALERGYHPVMLPVGRYQSERKEDTVSVPNQVIDLHRSRLIDGVILDKPHFLDAEIRVMHDGRVPIVVVNGGVPQQVRPGAVVPSVTLNDRAAGRIAAMHLIGLNHRRIAYLGRPFQQGPRAYHSAPVSNFREGFESAFSHAGLRHDPDSMLEGDMFDRDVNAAAIRRLVARRDRPTALVVGDDAMAIMAVNALTAMGINVPRDISVVGYGDLPIAQRLAFPPLTTVRVPLRDNGRRAAANLIALLEGESIHETMHVLEPELIVRATTASPRT